ncbi:MAG TPA: efflux RND transporter periplasmic adaptor subunit [Thermoanaerobaculaceae bacterium]|nr:efflux RND transporter periplasmic adaptor subunit [Thermoanaerobaculaceae bacterium]HRS17134.1 efflux RND transporter periplasmic adaptor subunit [Thermoanaerobaculaceae bacterium]
MRRWFVLLGLVAAAGLVLGRVVWKSVRGVEVRLAPVEQGRVVAAVYATGRVDTDRRATVRARVAAPLEAVLVGPGEQVAQGQVVARQERAEVELAVERAGRELEAARAALAEAADAAARAERLARQGLLPEDEWVRARERGRELEAAAAAKASALALAREQAGWVELRAPLAGAVSSLAHRAGDALREGDDVLTIVDLSSAYVRVAVDERDLGRVAPGQDVRLVFDAFPDRPLTGSVWRILPAVDRLTKSADILVELPAERPPLQLDLTATVNIVIGVVDGAVVVPRDALLGSGSVRQVVLVDAGSMAVFRDVRIGVCDARACQVVDGVVPGERVISPAPTGLRPGARVRVQ